MRFKPGDRVRMNASCKAALRKRCVDGRHVGPMREGRCEGCSTAHIDEFGESVGVVEGLTDFNNVPPGDPAYDPAKLGPEVDVRWLPTKLRYMYGEDDLDPA